MVNKIITLLEKLVQNNNYTHFVFKKWLNFETLEVKYNNNILHISLYKDDHYKVNMCWKNLSDFTTYNKISEEEYLQIRVLWLQLKKKEVQYQQDLLEEFIESLN